MKDFSNKYIFIFSSVMVIIVAAFLSTAAMLLQPWQSKNIEIEKKQNILASFGVTPEKSEVVDQYAKYVDTSFVLNSRNEIVNDADAFSVDLNAELKKPLEEQLLPVYHATLDDGEEVTIFPLQGKGLWGPIYGYISFKSDMNTVFGVTFDHKGETPGLGAEINTTPFESQFIGKKFFDSEKFVSVQVVKGGAKDSDIHGVDAISGGTITSKGLEKMLFDGIIKYEAYLNQNRK